MTSPSSDTSAACSVCGHPGTTPVASSCKENLDLLGGTYVYVQCQECHVINLAPLPSPDLLGTYYGLLDEKQKRWFYSSRGQALLAKMRRRDKSQPSAIVALARHLISAGEQTFPYWDQLKRGTIVDLGAGAGGFCLEARRRGWIVHGLEQSPASMQMARALGCDLIQADLASQQARELVAGADNVVLNHVFEHVADPTSFLEMLHTAMAPRARLVLLIPNPGSIWRYCFGRRWYGWDPPIHVHHYSARALRKILESHGFQILKLGSIRRSDSFAVALNQVGIRPGRLRLLMRVLMLPLMPLLAWFGIGPELLCVAQVGSCRSERAC